jgi:large subunit ribosomal protein L24
MKRIHKGDEVIVTTGRSKSQRGHVLRVLDFDRVLVENVNMVKKHQKPTRQTISLAELLRKNSNSCIQCPGTTWNRQRDRVGFQNPDDGRKVRVQIHR